MSSYYNLLNQANNLSGQSYVPYTGELVAGVNPQQYTGIGNINQYSESAQPMMATAEQMAQAAAQPITAGQIQQYVDPWTANVVNTTQAEFNNANAIQQNGIVGNAIAQGALGGNRSAVAQGIAAGQEASTQAPVIAGLEAQGYTQGANLAATEQAAMGQGALSMGNLATAAQNAGLTGANAQIGAGTLEQQTQQALDAAMYQQYLNQQAYPYQQLGALTGDIGSLGSLMGGTSTTTGPSPSLASQAGGLGLAGMGLFGSTGAVSGLTSLAALLAKGGAVHENEIPSIPESHATLKAQQEQLMRGHRRVQMFPHGTKELHRPHGIARVETEHGVFHYDPKKVDANHIRLLAAQGRENELLDLGPVTKHEIIARIQRGEMPLAIVERHPNGTEVRAALGTHQTVHHQIHAMEKTKSPGNRLHIENPDHVVRQRAMGGAVYRFSGGLVPHLASGGLPYSGGDDDITVGQLTMGPGAPAPPKIGQSQNSNPSLSSLSGFLKGGQSQGVNPVVPGATNVTGLNYDSSGNAIVTPTFGYGGVVPHFDSGGVANTPYSGGHGYIPSVGLVHGHGPPSPPRAPQQPNAQQMTNQIGSLTKALTGGGQSQGVNPTNVPGATNQYGVTAQNGQPTTSPSFGPVGMVPDVVPLGGGAGNVTGIYRRGGVVPGYADGGNPIADDFAALNGPDDGGVDGLDFNSRWSGLSTAPNSPNNLLDPKSIADYNTLQTYGSLAPEVIAGNDRTLPPYPDIKLPVARHDAPDADVSVADGLPKFMTHGTSDTVPMSDAASAFADTTGGGGGMGVVPQGGGGIDLSSGSKLWPALMSAGFGMMASRSPFPGVAIGEGGQHGVSTYTQLAEKETEHKLKQSEIENRAQQLANQLKHYQDSLAETTRYHNFEMQKPTGIGHRIDENGNSVEVKGIPDPKKPGFFHPIDPTTGQPDTETSVQPGITQPRSAPTIPPPPLVQTASLGEGIIPANNKMVDSGFDYRKGSPQVEKGMDAPPPMPSGNRSKEAVQQDGEYYLQTGKLPPVSRGKSPVAMQQNDYRNAVQNYGAALAASRGLSPEQVADGWRSAPGMMRFILGPDGRSTVSLGTAVRHLDTLKQMADAWKEGSTIGNWQTWNRLTSAVRREFGDQSVTNLESAARIVGPEIIKALGVAGAGTQHDRDAASGQFTTAKGIDQISGAINTTQKLLGGQLEGRQRQAAQAGVSEDRFKNLVGERPYEILRHIDRAPAAMAPPATAINALRQNPNRAAEFDAKYGQGAAVRVLGQ